MIRTAEPSFSEEKEAKRLYFPRPAQPSGQVRNGHAGGNIKVFWFFSSEKNVFLVPLGKCALKNQ
jgi:hypothetical protein